MKRLSIVGVSRAVSVQVGRPEHVLQIGFVLSAPEQITPEVERPYRDLAATLSQELEEGRPVEILLCDGFFERLRTIRASAADAEGPSSGPGGTEDGGTQSPTGAGVR